MKSDKLIINMIKAILFDFGGVIYQHPKEVIPEVLSKIYYQPLEVTVKEYAKYREYISGKITTENVINALTSRFKSALSIEEVKHLWLKYYSELAKANHDVVDLVKKLHKNYQVYLFTNTTEMSNLHNSKTGLYDLFDGLFKSYEMGLRKPDPAFYQRVVTKLQIKPKEILFIDDDEANLEPAKRLGIKTIYFNVLQNKVEDLNNSLRSFQVKV